MAQTGGQTNIMRIATGFLNSVNDAVPGGGDPNGIGDAPDQVGKWTTYGNADARKRTDIAVTGYSSTVYLMGGVYQYVQLISTSTATPSFGAPAFWLPASILAGNYIVTADASAINEGFIAGVFLGAPTKGNYCFIQVAGIAWATYRATVTNKTQGNLVLQLTTTQTFDAIADATGTYISGGTLGIKNIVGTAWDTPTDAGTKRINLSNTRRAY